MLSLRRGIRFNNMKIKALSLLCLVVLSGCAKEPESVGNSTNKDIEVETLFRYEGCTMYRFVDGRSHYFARCENSTETISTNSRSCGKDCVQYYDENIVTN